MAKLVHSQLASFRAHGMMRRMLKFWLRHLELLLILGLIVLAAFQYYVRPQSQSLAQMHESGYIRVLISDEPDSQYVFNDQHYGFEYALLSRFAEQENLELRLEVVPFAELLTLLNSGAGDIAVGGILANPYVNRVSTPTTAWYQAKTTVVYRRGTLRPNNLSALTSSKINASARYFGLNGMDGLQLVDDHRSEYELLSAVHNGSQQYALTTNYRARNAKHYLPNLNRSFILPSKVDLVWGLPKRHDAQLLSVIDQFLQQAVESELPRELAESYLTVAKRLSTYDVLSVHRKINNTLPKFEYAFRKAARLGRVDWQMLAALSYQESHWSNAARSPTGVRGIMQLTEITAKFLGVDDRMDMSQSIDAAARYLGQLRARLPVKIKEPERTWFAVGSYNLGFRHIMNAYRKAREQGLDRTKWRTISDLLPELYGVPFAQGRQAQDYVERIQIFTDILRFYDTHQREELEYTPTVAVSDSIELDSTKLKSAK